MAMTQKIRIYGDSRSGNCYKLQLACAQLQIPYDWCEIDVMSGATRLPDFLAMKPNGRVPLMELSDGRYLAESNAILSYLANDTELSSPDAYESANILRWMFFEQYSHEPYIAVARFIIKFLGNPPDRRTDVEAKKAGGYQALDVMENELQRHDFLANDRYSIADIALYAYTHVAHEGHFDLGGYPRIKDWLTRIAGQSRYVPMRDQLPPR